MSTEPQGSGYTVIHHAREDGSVVELARTPNLWLYSWGHLVVGMARGDRSLAPAYLYLEFRNVSDPTATIPAPTFDRGDGLEYYQGLASSPDSDYVRVPLASLDAARDPAYSGTTSLADGLFNQLVCRAYATQGAGVHGKAFNASANSKVYGSAIAAAPAPDDPTRDVLWAREYYDAANQVIVPATGSLYAVHPLTFR